MPTLNKVFIIGHLGRDPETRYAQSGTAIVNFSVATNDGTKDNKQTNWHKVVAFGKTAELCAEYLRKGSLSFIDGRIQYRTWDDKDGNKRYVTEIIAERVLFLGGQAEGEQREPAGNDDDVPF